MKNDAETGFRLQYIPLLTVPARTHGKSNQLGTRLVVQQIILAAQGSSTEEVTTNKPSYRGA